MNDSYLVPLLVVLALVIGLPFLMRLFRSSPQQGDSGNDPLAEADFHMAYGLYDDAAQIIRQAMDRESDAPDLVFKLVEIYFTAGNVEEFLSAARDYEARHGRSGHWDKIQVMGQSLAPDNRLFQ